MPHLTACHAQTSCDQLDSKCDDVATIKFDVHLSMQALRSRRTAQQTPLNRYSKRIVLLMSEAVRFLHQFERIYASGRCGDGLRLVSVGGGPSHPADDDCEREQNGGSQRHDRSHRSLLGRFESSPVSLLTPAQCE